MLPRDSGAVAVEAAGADGFEPPDALGLDLVERLLRRQTHVVHALGVVDAQPRALTPGQQQHTHVTIRNLLQTYKFHSNTVRKMFNQTRLFLRLLKNKTQNYGSN